MIAFRYFYLANIPHALHENVGDSDEDETVYESIADNHCLPVNKVEVSQYFCSLMLKLNFKFLVLGRLFHKERILFA